MARLDVMKNHGRIHQDISHGPASNRTSDVNAGSKFQQKTGRTRTPLSGDTAAKMSSAPAVNTSGANANITPGKQPAVGKVSSPLTNAKAAAVNGANVGKAPGRLMGSGR